MTAFENQPAQAAPPNFPDPTASDTPVPVGRLRSRTLLSRETSCLALIDVQEKLLPHMQESENLIQRCRTLLSGAALLRVPLRVSEQNPQKLGPTVPELRELLPGFTPAAKFRFSAAECLFGEPPAEIDARRQIVLCGIETHVCILQTALDLLAWGWEVFVVTDAVQSRFKTDRDWALRRIEGCGVTLVTVESVLFEWCETADTAEFRALSRLVKDR